MVPPPKERPEGKNIQVMKMFREVQILIGEKLKMFALHKMAVGGIKIRRGHERNRRDLLFQRHLGGHEIMPHLVHDLRLGAKELLIYQQGRFFCCEG